MAEIIAEIGCKPVLQNERRKDSGKKSDERKEERIRLKGNRSSNKFFPKIVRKQVCGSVNEVNEVNGKLLSPQTKTKKSWIDESFWILITHRITEIC